MSLLERRKLFPNVCLFVALLLFAGIALRGCGTLQPVLAQVMAPAQRRTFRVPFRSVNGLILLDAKVNDNAARLVLDTGSASTIVAVPRDPVPARLLEAYKEGSGPSAR